MAGWWSTAHTLNCCCGLRGSIGGFTRCSCSSRSYRVSATGYRAKTRYPIAGTRYQGGYVETTVVRSEREGSTRGRDALRLEWRADGSLWAVRGDEEKAVSVRRCFPWTEPTRHLSLRDADEEEFAFVRDPADLDVRSRVALEAALAVAGFVFEITRVLEIEEEVEIRRWRVETRQGPRTFQTRLDDWPRTLPHGGLLIRDLAGDLYHLVEPKQLDKHSRDLLWAFVD